MCPWLSVDCGRPFSLQMGREIVMRRLFTFVALMATTALAGGLLAAVPAGRARAVREALATAGVPCWPIGHVESSDVAGVALT